jgi:FecR protein
MLKTTFIGKPKLSLLLCLIGLLCFSAPKIRAQQPDQAPPADQPNQADPVDPSAASDANDPPTRVARISYVDGSVSFQPGGQGDWGNAARNRPMTIGDKIWTDKDSRAELQTGVVSIHLGSMTALSFLNLDQAITQMRLAEGSINFRVKEIREGDTYEVDTPNLAFTITQAGAFRIDVNENGDNTGITVIRGAGQVTASGKTYDLQAGQRGIYSGTDTVESTVVPQAPPADELDQWASQRDLGEQNSVSKRYVPEDMPGTQDLDNNGTWSEDGANGPVWYPSEVAPGWAPYSNGYWNYVGPWGWTWIDYAPWGFAPFHYGRWGYIGSRWGWYPGPRVGFSIYGPAFVGFLGGGFGFGFGVGFGVGWFPLGFGEPFHPWYHGGYGYVNRINVHNTYIHNVNAVHSNGNFNYAYAHNTHAVTAASRSAFTGGQAINRGAAHIDEASLRSAQVSNKAGFSPTRQSALGAANARGNVSRPPSSVENRSVMARTTPAAGASHTPVHTMNTSGLSAGHPANAGTTARQNQLSQSRPPSAGANNNNMRMQNNIPGNSGNKTATNNSRNWSAQGNTTDRGQAPNGFGSSNDHSPSNNSTMTARANNRPPWAGSGAQANGANAGGRSYTPQGNASSNTRSYAPQGVRGGNPAPTRTYSAPSRSYGGGSAPHASGGGSAPHGGGGGGSHGGGGGGSHGGGGGSHGHR